MLELVVVLDELCVVDAVGVGLVVIVEVDVDAVLDALDAVGVAVGMGVVVAILELVGVMEFVVVLKLDGVFELDELELDELVGVGLTLPWSRLVIMFC